MFDTGDGVLGVIGSIPPPTNTASWVDAKELDFWFSSESLANFRRVCTCAFLSRGTLRALQDFSPSRRSVLPNVFLVTIVPAALRSLTRSSQCSFGLIAHRSLDHWNSTRWALAMEPQTAGDCTVILCFLHLRIIAPTVVTFIQVTGWD